MKISKSKKELARIISENGGWRDGARFYAQDGCGEIWSYAAKPAYHKDIHGFTGDEIDIEIRAATVAGFHNTILSREEYFHLYPAPDADGWIEFDGYERPPGYFNAVIDVKLESGREITDSSGRFEWDTKGPSRIIAYRLHKAEPKPDFCESVNRSIPEPEAKPSIEQLAAEYRNKLDYAERLQRGADAAKADADAKLAELVDAGRVHGLVVSIASNEPELVITDWLDLQVGDEIEYIEGTLGSWVGLVGTVELIDEGDDHHILFRHGDKGEGDNPVNWQSTRWCKEFRFIRRP